MEGLRFDELNDTYRAIEALAVIIVGQRFDPSVAGFHWEAACETLCREQFIPIGLAVRTTLFQEERTVAEQFAAVCAIEAFRMEVLSNGIQAIALNMRKRIISACG